MYVQMSYVIEGQRISLEEAAEVFHRLLTSKSGKLLSVIIHNILHNIVFYVIVQPCRNPPPSASR